MNKNAYRNGECARKYAKNSGTFKALRLVFAFVALSSLAVFSSINFVKLPANAENIGAHISGDPTSPNKIIEISTLVGFDTFAKAVNNGYTYSPAGGETTETENPLSVLANDGVSYDGMNDADITVKLEADIDLASSSNVGNGGAGWVPIGWQSRSFKSTFDGNGHTISNLSINRNSGNYQGLFGLTAQSAIIKQLGVEGINIQDAKNRVGGIVGDNSGTIEDCYTTGVIKGGSNTGGLVGVNSGIMHNSFSKVDVETRDGDSDKYGGLAGTNSVDAKITNSYYAGTVKGSDLTGGIAGWNMGYIGKTYSTGNIELVNNESTIGGLVGGTNRSACTIDPDDETTCMDQKLEDSVSIMKTIANTQNSGTRGRVQGRVTKTQGTSGGLVNKNNYALDIMGSSADETDCYPVISDTNSFNNSYKTGGEISGFDVTASELLSTTENYFARTGDNWNTWTADDGWTLTPGHLPILSGISSAKQDSIFPNYISYRSTMADYGAATQDDPVHIKTVFDLAAFACKVNSETSSSLFFSLENDIDFNTAYIDADHKINLPKGLVDIWAPIGTSSNQFSGTFNGNYHTIHNLWINRPSSVGQGFFGYANGAAIIKNLNLANVHVTGGSSTGGLLGEMQSGSISEVSVSGMIADSASYVGGIVGLMHGAAEILNSYSSASVSGYTQVGGLVGTIGWYGSASAISNSYSTGNVTADSYYAGGIAGMVNSTARIHNCVNLTQSTVADSEIHRVAGHVSGDDDYTLNNNYGLSRTLVNQQKVTSEDPNSPNGMDAYTTQINKASFWKDTVGFNEEFWTIEDEKLPVLKGFSDGSQEQNASFAGKDWLQPLTGSAVSGLSAQSITSTSIRVTPPTLSSATGQDIEYAINTIDELPTSFWQTETTFSGLTADTQYYIFARSSTAGDYLFGTPETLGVKTAAQVAYTNADDTGHSTTPWWTFAAESGTLTINLDNVYAATSNPNVEVVGSACADYSSDCRLNIQHVAFTNTNTDNVTELTIGDGAFQQVSESSSTSLTSVSFPPTLTTLNIGEEAFQQFTVTGNTSLTSVSFPPTLTTLNIGQEAFEQYCDNGANTTLQSVIFPASLTTLTIDSYAFIQASQSGASTAFKYAFLPSNHLPANNAVAVQAFNSSATIYWLGTDGDTKFNYPPGSESMFQTLTQLPLTELTATPSTTPISSTINLAPDQTLSFTNVSAQYGNGENQPNFGPVPLSSTTSDGLDFTKYKISTTGENATIDGNSVSFSTTGEKTVTLSVPGFGSSITKTYTINVSEPDPTPIDPTPPETPEEISINPSEIQGAWVDANGNVHANQNGTITIILHEKLHDGKTVEAKLEDYKLTSSVDTDIIKDNTVTFPHASPHIITASLKSNSALTTQVLIEVEPTSVPDPNPTPDNPTVDPNTPSTPTNPINPSTNNASTIGTAQTGVPANVLGLVMLMMLLLGVRLGVRKRTV